MKVKKVLGVKYDPKKHKVSSKPLVNSYKNEQWYSKKLTGLAYLFIKDCQKELIDFVDENKDFYTSEIEVTLSRNDVAMDGIVDDISAKAGVLLNRLNAKWSSYFGMKAKPLADEMAEKGNAWSEQKSNEVITDLTGITIPTDSMTDELKQQIAAIVEENANLIVSIQSEAMTQIKGTIFRTITSRQSSMRELKAIINRNLKARYRITRNRAHNVALDQTRKLYNDLNATRMQQAAITHFMWVHVGGSVKPRPEHIEMSGYVYAYDNLPVIVPKTGERGLPGHAINCKCIQKPVLDFDLFKHKLGNVD